MHLLDKSFEGCCNQTKNLKKIDTKFVQNCSTWRHRVLEILENELLTGSLNIGLSVYTCVCVCVLVSVYVFVSMYLCVGFTLCVCVRVFVSVYLYLCMCAFVSSYVCESSFINMSDNLVHYMKYS